MSTRYDCVCYAVVGESRWDPSPQVTEFDIILDVDGLTQAKALWYTLSDGKWDTSKNIQVADLELQKHPKSHAVGVSWSDVFCFVARGTKCVSANPQAFCAYCNAYNR